MRSWNSSAPRFLDRPGTVDAFRRLAEEAAARDPRIRRVVLFGSLATGRATIASDADLMIELSAHPARDIDRIGEYLDLFHGGPLPVDVFPYTTTEIEARRERRDPFLARIEREGIELFRRPPHDT